MTLSHHEQRALERIAVDLRTEDPWLASTLAHDGWIVTKWQQRLAAATMFIVGMAMMAGAIFVSKCIPGGVLIVSVLGYLVMFDAALRWFAGPVRRRHRARFRPTRIGQRP